MFGIEEEYLLVELANGRVLTTPSLAVARRCREVMGEYFAEEMFRSQIEVASPVFGNLHEARQFFCDSRQRLVLERRARPRELHRRSLRAGRLLHELVGYDSHFSPISSR